MLQRVSFGVACIIAFLKSKCNILRCIFPKQFGVVGQRDSTHIAMANPVA